MHIPDTIKILGYDYNIDYEDSFNEGHEEMGRCCAPKQQITINEKLHDEQQASTLLHEIIEALNYHMEIGLEHNAIMNLEAGLYQVIKDNELVFYEGE